MDVYLTLFVLGLAGLAVMAAGGAGRGHAGHAHAGHAPVAHGRGAARGPAHGQHGGGRDALLALASPRVLFAVLLGVGAAGLLLRPLLGPLLGPVAGGLPLAAAALALGVLFERLAVARVWRFVEGFASEPARTLETALYDHARAASGFDARGEGLVALELDGQVVQILGRLRPEDRALRVRAGDRLRVEDVDAERHRCTVSLAGPA